MITSKKHIKNYLILLTLITLITAVFGFVQIQKINNEVNIPIENAKKSNDSKEIKDNLLEFNKSLNKWNINEGNAGIFETQENNVKTIRQEINELIIEADNISKNKTINETVLLNLTANLTANLTTRVNEIDLNAGDWWFFNSGFFRVVLILFFGWIIGLFVFTISGGISDLIKFIKPFIIGLFKLFNIAEHTLREKPPHIYCEGCEYFKGWIELIHEGKVVHCEPNCNNECKDGKLIDKIIHIFKKSK